MFDCAAKFQQISLNDQVLQGPDLTNKLVGVLLRFRQERIALMADVESMFHQVHVTQRDRDVLRFLWWVNDDLEAEPETFRMNAHLFGGVWSPSCCSFILRRTAEDNQSEFHREIIDTVHRNFYVDDCLKSVQSKKHAVELVQNLSRLLARGGFRLTKWISNDRDVLGSIPECDVAKKMQSLNLDIDDLLAEHALGVHWDVENDNFGYEI